MIIRHLVILLSLVAGVFLLAYGMKLWSVRRAAGGVRLSGGVARPTLFYFWTPTCTSCRRVQRPVIEELEIVERENVRIVSVNAQDSPDDAQRFGIWTVPTTVVVGANGHVRHVNTGPVDLETLRRQIKQGEAGERAKPAPTAHFVPSAASA